MLVNLKFFKKFPVFYYLAELLILASCVTFSLLMPKEYIYWNLVGVGGYTVGLFVSFALTGFWVAGTKKRGIAVVLIESFVFGAVGAGLPYVMHGVFNRLLLHDIYMVLNACCIVQFLVLAAANILIVLRSAESFSFKKTLREVLAGAVICVMLCLSVLPFSGDYFRYYFRSYSFLSEPSVFVGANNTYSVMFATSAPGTGVLTLSFDGQEKEYTEAAGGMLSYNSQIHRIDVPKEELEKGTYTLTSRQTMDSTGTVYRMGKTIKSKNYRFRPYQGNGDVSFLCVSDNQGTAEPTKKAVQKAAEKFDYDFVMLLGDNSEAFNEVEEDFINSLLVVAGLASKGEKPVYYTVGNHEYRGGMSGDLFKLMPTPSDTGDFYYSFTVGNAYFTVLNFTNEDPDDDERYGGLARFNEYKEKEYAWLQAEMENKHPETYKYNVMISHIPVINEFGKEASEYMCKEIIDLLEAHNVGYVVSGHSHIEPKEMALSSRPFKNLHAGSYYNVKKAFRNSIVHLKDGQYSYEIYDSEK